MVEHPNLVYTLLNQLRAHPTMKSKALQILTGGGDNGDSGMGVGDFNLPPSPTMAANAQNLNLFSPHGNDSPGMWSSGNEFGTSAQSFRAGPVSLPTTILFPLLSPLDFSRFHRSPRCLSRPYRRTSGLVAFYLATTQPRPYNQLLTLLTFIFSFFSITFWSASMIA